VDLETARIVREALQKAIRLLTKNESSLKALTALLSEKETVSGEEIEGIIGGETHGTLRPEVAEIPGSNGRKS